MRSTRGWWLVMALVGCSDDAYEFSVTANYAPNVQVSFEGDRIAPGETVSRSYPTYVDAKYDVVILDVTWSEGHTTIGTNPWIQFWAEGVEPELEPRRCSTTVAIDTSLTPVYEIAARDCGG